MISIKGREIEVKYGITEEQAKKCYEIFGTPTKIVPNSIDEFWELDYPYPAFLRYRHSTDEYEVKVEDQGGNLNRMELLLPRMMLLTQPDFLVHKKTTVWRPHPEMEVAVYYVRELDRWFFEIEVKTIKVLEGVLPNILLEVGLDGAQRIKDSLFTLMKREIDKCQLKQSLQQGF